MAFDIDPNHELDHSASLYQPTALLRDGADGFPGVDESHRSDYDEQGFFVINGAYSSEQVQAALDGIDRLILEGVPEGDRAQLQFESEGAEKLKQLTAAERTDYVRKLMNFVHLDARLTQLGAHEEMLTLMERLLGDRPAMFQDMALLKPAHIGREKPWHQDNAYFNLPADTPVVGIWIALDEATVDNGCMHFMPGGHRQGPVPHFTRRDWQICDSKIEGQPIVAVPLLPGDAVVFNGLTPHGTPTNRTATRRRALQFHYRPASIPLLSDSSERMRLFGGDGNGATC